MKIYAHHRLEGLRDVPGYKGYMIKDLHEFCAAQFRRHDRCSKEQYHLSPRSYAEPWTITLVDTGEAHTDRGRLRACAWLSRFQRTVLLYLWRRAFGYRHHGFDRISSEPRQAGYGLSGPSTGTYGALELDGTMVKSFVEKPPGDNALISGGFVSTHPLSIESIGDNTSWEASPLRPWRVIPACRLSPFRLSQPNGYLARQDHR